MAAIGARSITFHEQDQILEIIVKDVGIKSLRDFARDVSFGESRFETGVSAFINSYSN